MFARTSTSFHAVGRPRLVALTLAFGLSLAFAGCETPRFLYLSHMPPEYKNSSKISRIDHSPENCDHDHDHASDDDHKRVAAFEVKGLVKHPGKFELNSEQDLYLVDAIGMSGGTVSKSVDKVRLTRQTSDGGKPLVFDISLEAARHDGRGNVRLVPGDVIAVEHTRDSFMKSMVRTALVIGER